jgi:serine protease Do
MNGFHSKKWKMLMTAFLLTAVLGFTQCRPEAAAIEDNTPVPDQSRSEAVAPAPSPLDLSSAISRVAEATIPAVVHIEVTQRQEFSQPTTPFGSDPFFHFFFDTPNTPHKFKREIKGLGTGMMIDGKGHVLTNNHVVAGASEIQVLLADGRQYKADLVGADPKTDLAVIRIKADQSLPYVHFGDSDKIRVGDWVVAIGHPRGLDQTVTQGIISAKHRRGILDPTSYQDYLQTDAAINPGNSGGPLLNLQGEVVGVNAAIVSQSGGFEGIGFAIPSNMARHIARALIKDGKVERGWLGVTIRPLLPSQVADMDLDKAKGALVTEVVPGSPAETAGLKKGDLITRYGGKEISDAAVLQNEVAATLAGKDVTLEILRDKKKMVLTATIGSLEQAAQQMAALVRDRLGATVRPVIKEEDQKYGLPPGIGVAIDALDTDGVLAEAGFEKDDLILAIDNRPIHGVREFVDRIEAVAPGGQIDILALDHRTGQRGSVVLTTRR